MTTCSAIVHITEYFRTEGYGVFSAIAELSDQLKRLGLSQDIISAGLEAATPSSGVHVHPLPVPVFGKIWSYPAGFNDVFDSVAIPHSVVHLHGIWKAPQFLAVKRAWQQGIPTVLSPHNMLGEWFWRDGVMRHIKKKLYWNCISSPRFKKITAIHALTQLERDVLLRYFPKKKIQVIPNGIDVAKVDDAIAKTAGNAHQAEKYILVLGRLHPVKGLEMFIDAYSQIPASQRMRVIIAGPPHTEQYLVKLKKRVDSLQMNGSISFVGPVQGDEKWRLLKNAWVLCAPSYSEGMSMVALEAMSCHVPIVTTTTAGIPNVSDGGGLLIEPRSADLRGALQQVLSWSEAEQASRARAARDLVEKFYSWKVVGPQYVRFYESLR